MLQQTHLIRLISTRRINRWLCKEDENRLEENQDHMNRVVLSSRPHRGILLEEIQDCSILVWIEEAKVKMVHSGLRPVLPAHMACFSSSVFVKTSLYP